VIPSLFCKYRKQIPFCQGVFGKKFFEGGGFPLAYNIADGAKCHERKRRANVIRPYPENRLWRFS
jgi:hypothetical protein